MFKISVIFCALCGSAFAEPFPTPFNSEKGAPMAAEEAAASMELPPGFKCQVFAAEPDVQQPIAMAWDAKGRLWVAENYTYAENPARWDTTLRDRIIILEDKDGDGKHDGRKVFWEQGSYLTSVEIGYGGAWILHDGTLSFIADKNGDDVPDGPPEILLDGFNTKTIGHNIVNGLRWGPDGWLYGRHGITDTSAVGAPGTAMEKRTKLNCSIWRYHPTRKIFETVAHGGTNSWGHDWNADGELFMINTVIGHLWHVIPGAHYRRMFGTHLNPHVYEVIEQTADHFHWDTGTEKWSDIRKSISNKTLELGGGHAHVGMLIYQGGLWPKEYEGAMLTCNLHGNRINMDRLVREGCGYTGKHAPDFMKAKDKWFRGIDLLTGPDGNVFVADWSDSGECHDNDGVHRTSGRIYKIVYGEGKKAESFWRDRITWVDRTDKSDRSDLADQSDGLQRLHRASALQRLPLEARWPIATALAQHEEDAQDRQQPLMIWYGIEPAVAANPMKGVEFIASAKIPTVRRLVARRIAEDIEKNPAALDALVALMSKSNNDVLKDVLEGMAAGLDGFSSAKKPKGWDEFVSSMTLQSRDSLKVATTQKPGSGEPGYLQTLSLVFGSGRATDELIVLVKNADGDANARRNAFTSLTRTAKPELLPIVRSLINDKVLGTAARSGLAAYDDPNIPKALLSPWPERSQEQQAATVATLVTRSSYAQALLEAVQAGKVPLALITPYQARAIRSLNDADLTKKLTAVWGEMRDSPEAKKAELSLWMTKLTPERLAQGNASKGKTLFTSACAACHKLYGEGGMIGPDLTGGDRHKLTYLLENIIDPSAIVPADYRMSVFKLKDGRTITGVIPAQTERTVSVQTPAEKLTLERSQIAEQQQLAMSLMPEGLLTALGEENVVHLMAYLQSLGPVGSAGQ
jgi:putative membrane-bound dehydrogenase-like protein